MMVDKTTQHATLTKTNKFKALDQLLNKTKRSLERAGEAPELNVIFQSSTAEMMKNNIKNRLDTGTEHKL